MEDELQDILDLIEGNEVVIEPEPIFPDPTIPPMPQALLEETKNEPVVSPPQYLPPETKSDIVSDIMRGFKESRESYINEVPIWTDVEDFLESLSVEEARNIRKQLKSASIYGNAPLEQMFILQYGVIMRARSYSDMMERIDSHYHTRLSKTLGEELDARMDEHTKKLEKLYTHITRNIERAQQEATKADEARAQAYAKELEAKSLDISRVEAEFKKMVENHNLTLRNNIMSPIKTEQKKAQEKLLETMTTVLQQQRESMKARFFVTLMGVATGGGLLLMAWAGMKHFGLI